MAVTLGYAIFFAADLGHSIRFYRDILGIPLRLSTDSYAEFQTDGAHETTALHNHSPPRLDRRAPVQMGASDDAADASRTSVSFALALRSNPQMARARLVSATPSRNASASLTACSASARGSNLASALAPAKR